MGAVIYVICGEPGAGKSSYVERNKGPADLVWDWDEVGYALNFPKADPASIPLLTMIRDTFYTYVDDERERVVWIITASETHADRLETRWPVIRIDL